MRRLGSATARPAGLLRLSCVAGTLGLGRERRTCMVGDLQRSVLNLALTPARPSWRASATLPPTTPRVHLHDMNPPARGSACDSSMLPGGTHSRLAALHVLRNLRAREPPGRRWPDSYEVVAAADTNRDGHISEHELVALCVSVGAAWPEIRVRDVLRNCL